jgi:hypothetical protein
MKTEKPIFRKSKYPPTNDCQKLDAQISGLRNDKDLVYRNQMTGSKRDVNDALLEKELQFQRQRCSIKLENQSVYGTLDEVEDRFEEAEDRIIGESNVKRQVLLVSGGLILLVALGVLISK